MADLRAWARRMEGRVETVGARVSGGQQASDQGSSSDGEEPVR